MIVCGYQGIGKSTLAGKNNVIDLESSNFFIGQHRVDNWHICYCQTAIHLSQQGYTVLLSSHEVVRDYLLQHSSEPVVCIVPALYLKDEWVEKLHYRFTQTHSDKDFKAYINASEHYTDSISAILESDIEAYTINSMDYRLADLIDYIEALKFFETE